MQISLAPSLPSSTVSAKSLPRRLGIVLAASLAVAAAAHIAFPLPFTPVPFTLQPLAVLLVGLLLGPVDGGVALLAYLAEGAAGLPVFSPTGPGGLLQLLGPTGGFLMVYPVVAAIAGGVCRALRARLSAFPAALLACSLATAVLFTAGASWLAWLRPMPLSVLWVAAIAPFLPGELIKVAAAAGIYRALTTSSSRTS